MSDSVETGAEKRVGAKHCIHDLQDSCRAKWPKISESVSQAVSLVVEVVDDVVTVSAPDAGRVADPHIDWLTRQSTNTIAKVISLKPMLFRLKDGRKNA